LFAEAAPTIESAATAAMTMSLRNIGADLHWDDATVG
jgi:hypothetical protein